MDAPTVVCLRYEFSNSKILTVTEESVCNGMDIGSCVGVAHIFQLAAHIEVRMGPNWSRNCSQHILVAHCHCPIIVHFHHNI